MLRRKWVVTRVTSGSWHEEPGRWVRGPWGRSAHAGTSSTRLNILPEYLKTSVQNYIHTSNRQTFRQIMFVTQHTGNVHCSSGNIRSYPDGRTCARLQKSRDTCWVLRSQEEKITNHVKRILLEDRSNKSAKKTPSRTGRRPSAALDYRSNMWRQDEALHNF